MDRRSIPLFGLGIVRGVMEPAKTTGCRILNGAERLGLVQIPIGTLALHTIRSALLAIGGQRFHTALVR